MNTHSDDVFHFLSVQAAVSIPVENFKRPSQFVFEFSTQNKMNRRHVLHEVYLPVLGSKQTVDRW